MAFYNVNIKAVNESAVQDPDDIGVDLDQVEKDIAGPDGIEAHRDEVEAAEEGMIGDPLEEAYDIMYEAEYNYNQIMKCIGIHEISEASMGREMVLEAADIKGFFAKVKEFLTGMFRRITEVVKKILGKLDTLIRGDKKFVTSNKEAIERGAALLANGADNKGNKIEWSFEGYQYKAIGNHFDNIKTRAEQGKIGKMIKALYESANSFGNLTVDQVREQIEKDLSQFENEDFTATAINDLISKEDKAAFANVKTIEDMVTTLTKVLRGTEVKVKAGDSMIKNLSDMAYSCLSDAAETKAIRKTYGEIKEFYSEQLKMVADMEKAVTKDTKYADYKLRVCSYGIKGIKAEANVANAGYSVFMKVARAKRAQYRKLAIAFASKGGAKTADAPKQESTTSSIFGNIQII